MKLTEKRKHLLAASAALTFACLIVASVAVLAAGGAADVDGHGQRPRQPQASVEIADAVDGSLAEAAPASALPVITRRYREPRSTTNSVGEHPDVPAEPSQIATGVVEPVHALPFELPEDGQAECQEFRTLIGNGRDWNVDVVLAMAWRESRCDAQLVSITNDWGLLQLNATCWAGAAIDGLPEVHSLPDSVAPLDLRCDGRTQSTPAAQWCYRAKEAVYDTGDLPSSPCDAWLDPTVNVAVAYEIWERYGWRPWCFNDQMRATSACRAAGESP